MKILVTGGAGFIGSNFVRFTLDSHSEDSVVVLDKLTYAGRRENFKAFENDPRFDFIEGDICDPEAVRQAMEGCDAAINFAAETHVDRSIQEPGGFIQNNVYGTYVLLEAARDLKVGRYLQVSTDEVYGSIDEGSFTETSPLDPSSPYSASKASGDLQVSAFVHTSGIEAVITRSSNNYGPNQYPEKLIPLCILNALGEDPLPVYGDGMQVRDWLHVTDNCKAIDIVLRRGKNGEVYNIGAEDEHKNIEVVRELLRLTDRDESLIEYVKDRPGHDRRYSLDCTKTKDLGWEPEVGFETGLEQTVNWYKENEWWWQPIRSGEYRDFYERQYGKVLRTQ